MSDNERLTVREAARRRIPLAGADAQALEGALALTERERDEWRKRYEALPGSLRDAHDVLLGLQKELSHALATVETYKALAAKAEEKGFVWGAVMRQRDEVASRARRACQVLIADAEQAIHNEAFMERQRIVAWIRARHAHGSLDCSLSLWALDALRVMADEIERGEHER